LDCCWIVVLSARRRWRTHPAHDSFFTPVKTVLSRQTRLSFWTDIPLTTRTAATWEVVAGQMRCKGNVEIGAEKGSTECCPTVKKKMSRIASNNSRSLVLLLIGALCSRPDRRSFTWGVSSSRYPRRRARESEATNARLHSVDQIIHEHMV
jgi:hypothetical protein